MLLYLGIYRICTEFTEFVQNLQNLTKPDVAISWHLQNLYRIYRISASPHDEPIIALLLALLLALYKILTNNNDFMIQRLNPPQNPTQLYFHFLATCYYHTELVPTYKTVPKNRSFYIYGSGIYMVHFKIGLISN
jgi:hypothetical protein